MDTDEEVRHLLISQFHPSEQRKDDAWEFTKSKLQRNEKIWSEMFAKAMVSLNVLLDAYQQVGCAIPTVSALEEIDSVSPFAGYQVDLTGDAKLAADGLRRQFHVASSLIVHLLSSDTTAEVTLPLRTLLDLLDRVVVVPLKHPRAKSATDIGALVDISHSLQLDALNILETLILTLKTTLATESRFINHLLLHILQETKEPKEEKFIELRSQCYHVLSTWMVTMSSYVGFTTTSMDQLVKVLSKDIKPYEVVMKLIKASANASKKKGKSNLPVGLLESEKQPIVLSEAEVTLCSKALKALCCLISSCEVYMTEKQYLSLSSSISTELQVIYRRRLNVSGLYAYSDVRMGLLRVLRSLLLVPHFPGPRPLETSIVLFNEAHRFESDLEVKLFCSESVNMINSMVHPIVPARQVEIVAEEVQKVATEEENEDEEISHDLFREEDVEIITDLPNEDDASSKESSSESAQENGPGVKTITNVVKGDDLAVTNGALDEEESMDISVVAVRGSVSSDANLSGILETGEKENEPEPCPEEATEKSSFNVDPRLAPASRTTRQGSKTREVPVPPSPLRRSNRIQAGKTVEITLDDIPETATPLNGTKSSSVQKSPMKPQSQQEESRSGDSAGSANKATSPGKTFEEIDISSGDDSSGLNNYLPSVPIDKRKRESLAGKSPAKRAKSNLELPESPSDGVETNTDLQEMLLDFKD